MADSFKLIVLNVISKYAHKNQFIIQVSRRIIDNQLAILYYVFCCCKCQLVTVYDQKSTVIE